MKNEKDFELTNKILTVGIIVIVAVCILFFIANIVFSALIGMDKAILNYDYLAIMFIYFSLICFYSFSKFKIIYHLVIGIGFCMTFICLLALHFINLIE